MPSVEELDQTWDPYVRALGQMVVEAGAVEHAVGSIGIMLAEAAGDQATVDRLEAGRWELARLCDDIKRWMKGAALPADVDAKLRALIIEAKALGGERNLIIHSTWLQPTVFFDEMKIHRVQARGLKFQETPLTAITDLTAKLLTCSQGLYNLMTEDLLWVLLH